jgi:tetratricopeptide (TPR) repeat protein
MKRFLTVASLFSLLALALASGEARAQTGAVRGRVVDEENKAMEGASVEIDFQGGVTRKLTVKTKKNGEYIQVGLRSGPYKITASKEGYGPDTVDVRVSMGDPTQVRDLTLTSAKAVEAQREAASGIGEIRAAFTAATEMVNAGKLDEAEAAFKAIEAKHPEIPEIYQNLAYISMQRKDYAAAEAAYQKAVDLRPEYADAWVGLARALQLSGQGDKAMEVLEKASAANESSASLQFNLGLFYMNAQRSDKAEEAFKKAEALDASNTEVLYYLGTIALNKGDTAGCIERLEKYLASSPTNAQNAATAQGLLGALKPKK